MPLEDLLDEESHQGSREVLDGLQNPEKSSVNFVGEATRQEEYEEYLVESRGRGFSSKEEEEELSDVPITLTSKASLDTAVKNT